MTDDETTTETVDDRLDQQPASAKLVYKVLEYTGSPLTQQEIAEEAMLAPSTTRQSLYELEDAGLIEFEYRLEDTREKRYYIEKC